MPSLEVRARVLVARHADLLGSLATDHALDTVDAAAGFAVDSASARHGASRSLAVL